MNFPNLDKIELHKIAEKGKKLYSMVKSHYEPTHRGEYLAIDAESGDVYLGQTSIEAVKAGKKIHPDKIFYLQRIGFDTALSIARENGRI